MRAETRFDPERRAWEIGAWWALLDWCEAHNQRCLNESAAYQAGAFGRNPQSINDCGFAHAIGGAIDLGYETTSKLLGQRIPKTFGLYFAEKYYVPKCPK